MVKVQQFNTVLFIMKKLFLILFILGNISLVVAQETWESIEKDTAGRYPFSTREDFIKIGINSPKVVRQWMNNLYREFTSAEDIEYFLKHGIKTPKEYLPYKKISKRKRYHIIFLKELNIKPNNLNISISNSNLVLKSKEVFLSTYKFLKKNKCKRFEGNFITADEYDNKGKCYSFGAKMFQRLDRTNGLAFHYSTIRGEGNLFYAVFNKPWRDGAYKEGFIKGLGNYRYQTSGGSMKNVAKGKVIKFGF